MLHGPSLRFLTTRFEGPFADQLFNYSIIQLFRDEIGYIAMSDVLPRAAGDGRDGGNDARAPATQSAGYAGSRADSGTYYESLEAGGAADGEMSCPVCGMPMPDLKGGKASICRVCGFKDSCCF